MPEPPPTRTVAGDEGHGIDLRGTLRIVGGVPGLPALIVFSCINNVLGGSFMALMDAYGLSMVSVQAWGLLWGVLSTGVIVGGLVVAKVGLGRSPVRTLLLVNLVLWTVMVLFPLRSNIWLLAAGMMVFMLLSPFAEAAEQTVLQRVVPFERQGRVFGFAQSVEQAASPLTAFLVAPFTELVVIPAMTDGAPARLDRRLVRHGRRPRHRAGVRGDGRARAAVHRWPPCSAGPTAGSARPTAARRGPAAAREPQPAPPAVPTPPGLSPQHESPRPLVGGSRRVVLACARGELNPHVLSDTRT